jgi:acyl carrier protein
LDDGGAQLFAAPPNVRRFLPGDAVEKITAVSTMPPACVTRPRPLVFCGRRSAARRVTRRRSAIGAGGMEQAVIDTLATFITREILEGHGAGLTETTPLLSLGILDSFSLLAIVNFMNEHYGIQIDLARIDTSDMATLRSMAQLVLRSSS